MTRVPNNKGSYFPRKGGGFQVKLHLGWSEEEKRYIVYHEDVTTEAEAIFLIKAANDFMYHGGTAAEIPAWRKGAIAKEQSARLTVEQFAEDFISLREKQKRVEPRTIESDRQCFERIRPYIGKMALSLVTPHDIDSAYARMRSNGSDNLNNYAYSGTTLQKTHAFLFMLFSKAVDYDYIQKNPLEKVERPKRDTPEKSALTSEQAQKLFATIANRPLASKPVGVLLCLCCGLRLSEMLALRWKDYKNGAINVTKALAKDKQDYAPTKNGKSRTVPCPPPLVSVLADWRDVQKQWFKEKGLRWSESAPMVNSRVGNHTLQRTFEKWFSAEKKKYPIPDDFTIHGLRHTYATLLNRDCGVDARTTRSMTGHQSEQAFATYTHTSQEWQQRAARNLGDIIAPCDDSKRCQNCKFWTASPLNATEGTCWADGNDKLAVTEVSTLCPCGKFTIRTNNQ